MSLSIAAYLELFDASVDSGSLTTIETNAILAAQPRVSVEVFGSLYEQAVARVAAHILELRRRQAASLASGVSTAGPVTSVKTGDLAVSYGGLGGGAGGSGDERYFGQTEHGQEYLALRASCLITPRAP